MKDNFQLGDWEVHPQTNEIQRSEEIRHLEPKAMDVLCYLTEHAGEVLTKERLIQAVWADTFVTDDALKYAISSLRKTLDDSAVNSRYIRTITRRGYQLIAEVQNHLDSNSGPDLKEASDDERKPPAGTVLGDFQGREKASRSHLVIAVVAILVVITFGWWVVRKKEPAAAPGEIQSIAVLPFVNLSSDPEQEYFADGMTETLINDLSRIGALNVIARSSSMRYKGTKKPLKEIARDLNVEALLEGSVQRDGDRVRISIQLIEAATNRNLWAHRYDRNLSSILVLQGEVARAIAHDIRLTLTPEEKDFLTRSREIDPKAYEAYLKGLSHFSRLTLVDLETAQRYFKKTLEIKPGYAPAQAGIAATWAGRLFVGAAPPREIVPKWREAVLRAVELDDQLSEVHRVMAAFKTWGDWDWKSAETSFRRAIEMNPNDSLARSLYSHYLLIMKRSDEAIAQVERAVELDPFNPFVLSYYGIVLQYGTRQYDAAIDLFQRVLKLDPNHHVAKKLYRIYLAKGMQEEAFEALTATIRDPEEIRILGDDYAEGGFKEVMSGMAERTAASSLNTYIPAHFIAIYYSLAGNNQQALNWLERAIEERDPNVTYMGVVFAHRNLHDDPRFRNLLRRMNFPEDVLGRYLEE